MKRERINKTEESVDLAYKIALYPNKLQQEQIAKTLGCCRYVYNQALNERITEYEEKLNTISYQNQQNKLPAMKKDKNTEWLSEVDSTALQNSLRDLQNAFDNFYRGVKNGNKVGYPKFKCKRRDSSYRTTNNNNSIEVKDDNHIKLPLLGNVKCKIPKKINGKILNATITKTPSGKYEASIMCEEVLCKDRVQTGKAVGIDLGIKNLAITSDGQKYDNTKSYNKNLKKLKRAQRELSRKTKGSKNREKQRKKLASLHKKVKNQRLDAMHKMTRELVDSYDFICIENLDVTEMKKNHCLAREISDASWGEIKRQLQYKCEWYGSKLIMVDKWYPSSQTCSECGHVNTEVKNLSVRKWKCPECGTIHDRDVNAAINILNEGLKQLA